MPTSIKEDVNRYKDKRRSLPSDKTRPNKNKRARPYIVQYKFSPNTNLASIFPTWGNWTDHKKYRTKLEAKLAIKNLNRKGVFTYRLKRKR